MLASRATPAPVAGVPTLRVVDTLLAWLRGRPVSSVFERLDGRLDLFELGLRTYCQLLRLRRDRVVGRGQPGVAMRLPFLAGVERAGRGKQLRIRAGVPLEAVADQQDPHAVPVVEAASRTDVVERMHVTEDAARIRIRALRERDPQRERGHPAGVVLAAAEDGDAVRDRAERTDLDPLRLVPHAQGRVSVGEAADADPWVIAWGRRDARGEGAGCGSSAETSPAVPTTSTLPSSSLRTPERTSG